ncbi:Ldh family oxidoreductase [Sphingomonas sp. IW22]|uniref:Ldh family oxidoreductase n=1 Tax=Sphingomonas sp. IW22 TaxID=3242489 RepID=UPI00352069E8
MERTEQGVRLTLGEVRELASDTLSRHGLRADHVDAVVETIVAGERDRCASHGVYRLTNCVHTLKSGKVKPDADPRITPAAAAIVRVDADGGFAQRAFQIGAPLLVEKARANGIAALAINHCVHFAALWPEIEALTAQGLVAIACTPSHAWVAPAGGRKPLFGTNPIAFGWPRPDRDPFVFDFATSAVARGEIELHRRAGKAIPKGWTIDADGNATTDPEVGLAGALLTFGGHKGSALSAMIELIAGPLIGDLTSAESLAHDDGALASPYGGELVIAIDPAGFLGDAAAAHIARAEALFDGIEGQGARLPSTRRFAARRETPRDGVLIPTELYDALLAL